MKAEKKKKKKYLKSLALYEILKGNISLTFRTFLSSLICSLFLILSLFVSLCFFFFFLLKEKERKKNDDDDQQVNTRKNKTKTKKKKKADSENKEEGEKEIRGHEVFFFFSFSPAKQQVLFGNEWRTSREKKRKDRPSYPRRKRWKWRPRKTIQNPLSPKPPEFFSCIYLCRFIQPKKKTKA